MKKLGTKLGIPLLSLALLALTATPALARGVGIDVDGKTYTFYQDCGGGAPDGYARCEIDGKTFLIGTDEVIVREAGEADRHFPLTDEVSADATATDAQGGTAEYVHEVTVIASGEGAQSVTYCFDEGDDLAQTASSEDFESGAAETYVARDWSAADAAEYAIFAPYGLRCDEEAGKLYYLGEPVRVFEDAREVDGGVAELGYFDEAGTVDVRSIRDAKGELTGLEALSDAEFASRDLRKWTEPEPVRMEATATSGGEPTPGERAALFKPYAPFGLRYDAEADALYCNGRPVRNFLDVRSSNGEALTGGKFQGSMTQFHFDGEVDVTILRDYAHPDESGEGKIIGVELTEATE